MEPRRFKKSHFWSKKIIMDPSPAFPMILPTYARLHAAAVSVRWIGCQVKYLGKVVAYMCYWGVLATDESVLKYNFHQKLCQCEQIHLNPFFISLKICVEIFLLLMFCNALIERILRSFGICLVKKSALRSLCEEKLTWSLRNHQRRAKYGVSSYFQSTFKLNTSSQQISTSLQSYNESWWPLMRESSCGRKTNVLELKKRWNWWRWSCFCKAFNL